MPENSMQPLILCFGEALWDVFPDDLHPGGAPLNVAYHLSWLGYRAAPVTAVGRDGLGIRLLRQMMDWGLEMSFVTQVDHRLTGLVKVILGPSGNAVYEVQEGAAWDWIELDSDQLERAKNATAIVFGTLALRGARNRTKLAGLLARCPDALKIYDVNLRPPHTRTEIVWEVAKHADVIKLTDAELMTILPNVKKVKDTEAMARQLRDETGCQSVCITSGAEGAGTLRYDAWFWAAGQPVNVNDTVGAGDAFLAGLLHGLISNLEPQTALENACRMGEFVAAREGATPPYKVADISKPAVAVFAKPVGLTG